MHVLVATDGSRVLGGGRRPRGASCSKAAEHVTLLIGRQRDPRRRRGWLRGIGVLARGAGDGVEPGAGRGARRARAHRQAASSTEKIDKRIEVGDVGGTVCHVAEKLNVDVIVVGSHGRTGFNRLLLGLRERADRAARAVPGARRPSPAQAVALAVRVRRERVAARRAERPGRVAERDDRDRPHVLGE